MIQIYIPLAVLLPACQAYKSGKLGPNQTRVYYNIKPRGNPSSEFFLI